MAVQHCKPHTAALARPDLTTQFVAEIRGRFRPIRGRVRHFAAREDGFGLRESAETAALADGDEPEDWPDAPGRVKEARTPAAKARAFISWLREVLRNRLLEPVGPGKVRRLRRTTGEDLVDEVRAWDHWTASYVDGSVREAWESAGGRLRVRGGRVSDTQLPEGTDIRAAYDVGVRPELLRELYLVAYDGLEDIADGANGNKIRATITEGIAAGINPRDIADELTANIRGLQARRAETHTRTVTAHARTESTFDRYEAAGESVVSHVEFSDSSDARVCPFCRRLDGVEMTIEEMRGTHVLWRGDIYRLAPPAHANGRCVPLPSVGAEPPTEPLSDRVPGTILTTTANPHALSQ